MAYLYKELQPIDAYTIMLAHPFTDYDRQLVTLFYQPLIGRDAMSLFMTLWADAEQQENLVYNHYHLMNILTMPLGPVFEARISLEAIGLLRTSRKKSGDAREFLYELLPPLDAKAFFADPLLSTFLFSKIGEQSYRGLRARFSLDLKRDNDFEDVSRTFLDVYTPIQKGTIIDEVADFKGRTESLGVPFVQTDFDFDLLQSGLSEQMVPQAALSTVSKAMIAKLAFLYTLNPLDMQKVVIMALDEDLKLPEERLRKAASEFYKMNITKQPPQLQKVFVQEPPQQSAELKSRGDANAYYLENTSPIEILRELRGGKEPLSVDVELAERLVNTYELSYGVVNTLLQYVYLRNDGKLTNKYVERIASHWANKKLETAEAAMELARQEHDKYTKWKNEGQKPAVQRKPTREEKVPDWFYKKEQPQDKKEPKKSVAVDEERRRLLKELGVTGNGVE